MLLGRGRAHGRLPDPGPGRQDRQGPDGAGRPGRCGGRQTRRSRQLAESRRCRDRPDDRHFRIRRGNRRPAVPSTGPLARPAPGDGPPPRPPRHRRHAPPCRSRKPNTASPHSPGRPSPRPGTPSTSSRNAAPSPTSRTPTTRHPPKTPSPRRPRRYNRHTMHPEAQTALPGVERRTRDPRSGRAQTTFPRRARRPDGTPPGRHAPLCVRPSPRRASNDLRHRVNPAPEPARQREGARTSATCR